MNPFQVGQVVRVKKCFCLVRLVKSSHWNNLVESREADVPDIQLWDVESVYDCGDHHTPFGKPDSLPIHTNALQPVTPEEAEEHFKDLL